MSNDTLGYQNPSTVDKNLAAQKLTRTTTDGTAVSTVVDREEVVIGDPTQDLMAGVSYFGVQVEDVHTRRLLELILVEMQSLNHNFREAFGNDSPMDGEGDRI